MVTKPISQNVTVSAEDGSVRLLVNPDGSINVNTSGGTTADVNLSEVGGTAVVTGGANGLIGIGGNVASGVADTGNPVKVGGVFNTNLPTLAAGQRGDLQITSNGQLVAAVSGSAAAGADGAANTLIYPMGSATHTARTGLAVAPEVFNGATWDRVRGNTTGAIVIPPQGWTYAAAATGIVNTTTAVTIKGAAGANVRNYLTGLTIATDTLGAATELAIRDGSGGAVLWRTKLQTGPVSPTNIQFPTPLYSTANTLLEVVTLTATVTGGVFVDATGYTGP